MMGEFEIIATVFGLTCVFLTIRQNIWCWPTGLVQVSLYIWIFYQTKLYSDMGLHVICADDVIRKIFIELRGDRLPLKT